MKAYKILLFITGVLAMLGVVWLLAPAGAVEVAGVPLHFPSYERTMAELTEEKVDVDEVLQKLDESFVISDSLRGMLQSYKDFILENPNRICLPDDDYTFFDNVFGQIEKAARQGKVYRILYYGDSQIELDRITGVLRDSVQKRFGGGGPGMFPPYARIPSPVITTVPSGGFRHYSMVADSIAGSAPHNRYGMLAQFSAVRGSGSVALKARKSFSKVTLLLGNCDEGFSVELQCDTLSMEKVCERDSAGVQMLQWSLPRAFRQAALKFRGNAEIYGIALDGRNGVAVDNVALRGCSGTIFTRIDAEQMKKSMSMEDVRIIVLEFGGNAMPGIKSEKMIENYVANMARQIDYFHRVAPQAKIIFVGPADMGKTVDGRVVTWPLLPELVEALKTMALGKGAAFWDMFHVMGGENSMVRWVAHSPQYAGPDYIHFTTKGAEFIGNALARSFMTYYDFYDFRKDLTQEQIDMVLE